MVNKSLFKVALIITVLGVFVLNNYIYNSSFIINFIPGVVLLITLKLWKRKITIYTCFYFISFMVLSTQSTGAILSSIIFRSINVNIDSVIISTVYLELCLKMLVLVSKMSLTKKKWTNADYILLLTINIIIDVALRTVTYAFDFDEIGIVRFLCIIVFSLVLEVILMVVFRKMKTESYDVSIETQNFD